jgi:hypothetical protein
MKKQGIDALLKLASNAGLKKSGFTQDAFFYGWLYKCLIWEFALYFANGESKCELTNSEYAFDEQGNVREVAMILCFDNKTMNDFALFLVNHKESIPLKLREMFVLSAGSNYNEQNTLFIDAKEISLVSKEEWLKQDSDGSLTDEICEQDMYVATRIFRKMLRHHLGFKEI